MLTWNALIRYWSIYVNRRMMMLRSSELAREIGLSKATVLRLANEGVIPSSRLPSGHYRFDLDEVKAALRVKETD